MPSLKMRFLVCLLIISGCFGVIIPPALASCAFLDSYPIAEYKILKTWPITHNSDEHITGCLGKIKNGENEILAFMPYNFLCSGEIGNTVEMSIAQACCDTGRAGDYACGVIPNTTLSNFFGGEVTSKTQTNLTAIPTESQFHQEIIMELIGKLEKGSFYGSGSMADRLIGFAKNQETREAVEAYRARLIAMLNNDEHTNNLQAARILLALDTDTTDTNIYKRFLVTIPLYPEEQQKALVFYNQHPNKVGPEIVAVLKDILGTTEKDEAGLILKILAKVNGSDLIPHLTQIYNEIMGRKKAGYDVSDKQMEKDLASWEKMVCDVFPMTADLEYQRIFFDIPYSSQAYPDIECFRDLK